MSFNSCPQRRSAEVWPSKSTVNTWTESSKVDRCVKRTPVDQPLIYILYSTVHTTSGWMHLSAGTRDLVVLRKKRLLPAYPHTIACCIDDYLGKARRRWSLAALTQPYMLHDSGRLRLNPMTSLCFQLPFGMLNVSSIASGIRSSTIYLLYRTSDPS